jgi:hypothetical protein
MDRRELLKSILITIGAPDGTCAQFKTVQPTDVVILYFPHRLTPVQAKALRVQLRAYFPDHRVLVLSDEARLFFAEQTLLLDDGTMI